MIVIDVIQRTPRLTQRHSKFERARVPAVETPFEFHRAKQPLMKRSSVGRMHRMDAWRQRYLRGRYENLHRECSLKNRGSSRPSPAAQVCERARIAALPLHEIGSRLVPHELPGLVVFQHGRNGNGVGVIRKQQIGASAMGIAPSVLIQHLVHLVSSRQMCLEDFCWAVVERHRSVKAPKAEWCRFSGPNPGACVE